MALFDFSGGKKDKQKELADKLAKIKDLQRPPNQVRAKTGFDVGSSRDETYQKFATPSQENRATRKDVVPTSPLPSAAKAALAKAKKKK